MKYTKPQVTIDLEEYQELLTKKEIEGDKPLTDEEISYIFHVITSNRDNFNRAAEHILASTKIIMVFNTNRDMSFPQFKFRRAK